MKSRLYQSWFNDNGVVRQERQGDFDAISKEFKKILKKYEKSATYRDLYEVGWQASHSAVGEMVADMRTILDAEEYSKSRAALAKAKITSVMLKEFKKVINEWKK